MRVLLRKGLSFSFHDTRQNSQGYRRHNQQAKALEPYKYFLNYTYTPLSIASINSDHISSINYYEIQEIFKKLNMKQREGFLNYPLIQRFLKIRSLIIYLEARHRRWSFIQKAQSIYRQIFKEVIDYKYSELYEEGLLIKMVENYRDLIKIKNKQAVSIEFAGFLQQFVISAWEFQKQMNVAANILGMSIPEFEQSAPKLRVNSLLQKSLTLPLPQRIFMILNRPIQYNETYNSFQKSRKHIFNNQYHKKLAQQLRSYSDDYKLIFERQLPLLKNTCLTRLDYLVAMDYIISIQMPSDDSQHRLIAFMGEWKVQWKQRGQIKGDPWLLELLVCYRITQRFIESPKFIGKMKQFIKQFNLTCLQIYKKALNSISTNELCLLISHHSSIFKSYLIVNFKTQQQMIEVKSIYLSLFKRIFSFHDGGLVFFEHLKDLQFIFQAILAICSKQDTPVIHQIMKNYEKILILKPSIRKIKIINSYYSQYFICMKFGFKSNIIAENIWKQIDYFNFKDQVQEQNRIRNEQEKGANQKKQKNISQQFTKLLLHFFYIQIIEEKEEKYKKVEQIFLILLKGLDFKLLIDIQEKNRMNDGKRKQHIRKYEQELDINQQQSQNQRIKMQLSKTSVNQFYLILLILQKTSLSHIEGAKKIVRQKIIQIFKNNHTCQTLKKCISYPGIYEFIHIINDNNIPQIPSLKKIIDDIEIELDLVEKQTSSQASVSHRKFQTQEYYLFLDNFLLDPLNINLQYSSHRFPQKNRRNKKQIQTTLQQKNKPKKARNDDIIKVQQAISIKTKTKNDNIEPIIASLQNISLPKTQKIQQTEKMTLKTAQSILQMLLTMPFPRSDPRPREIQSRKPRYFVHRQMMVNSEVHKTNQYKDYGRKNVKPNQNTIQSQHYERNRRINVGLLKMKSKTVAPLWLKNSQAKQTPIQKQMPEKQIQLNLQLKDTKIGMLQPQPKIQQKPQEKSRNSEEPKAKMFKSKDMTQNKQTVVQQQPSKSFSISSIRQKLKLLQSKIKEKGEKLTEISQNKEILQNQQPSDGNINSQINNQELSFEEKAKLSAAQSSQLDEENKAKSNKKKKTAVKKVSLRPSKKI